MGRRGLWVRLNHRARLVVGVWLAAVAEFSVSAGWFTAELTASTPGGIGGGLVPAILGGSLALLSDAAHMLTDATAIGLSLVAIRLAQRPTSTSSPA